MEQHENKAIITFDTLYTSNHIQILKVLLPYFDGNSRKNLAIMIKFMELRYTMEYFTRHTTLLDAASCDDPNGSVRQPDIVEIFEQIKNFCTPSERAMFDQLANIKRSMEMYEEMMSMMQLFQQFAPESDASTGRTQPQEQSCESGSGRTDDSSRTDDNIRGSENASPTLGPDLFSNANPLDMLRGMLSPEQQAMFEMFQSSFGNGGD